MQGDEVGELMLRHASYHECSDVPLFKHELSEIVQRYRHSKLQLGQVGHVCSLCLYINTDPLVDFFSLFRNQNKPDKK